MNAQVWQVVRPILEFALELAPEARPAFLETACSDRDIRAEVESLLAAHDATYASLLKTGAAPGLTFDDETSIFRLTPGIRIGAYRVVNEIAVGGMGAVYRVTRADGQYEQDAALKIVRVEFGGEAVAARFRNERQILARFDHPNIAKILDGGVTADKIPYLVMELIDGLPITTYCDTQRLSIEERIELVLQVCSAVHYAHQHLIVHRDLKPSNILVTTAGVAKLLDFGIAKALDEDLLSERDPLTVMGSNVLTPDYASPEQVRGEPVTTATDVYSLGLLLYELLSGRRAVRLRNRTAEELTLALERDPVRPSDAITGDDALPTAECRRESVDRLRRRLRGDLDNIVMKAIRKAPVARYASVLQLIDDLRRHLDGLPVEARGDSYTYRIGKFVRRHRPAIAGASLLLLSLVGGIVATSYQAHQERLQRARAERHFQSVRALADTFIFRMHDSIAQLPGSTEARGILVSTGLEYLNTLAQEAGDDRALTLDLAKAFNKLAEIQGHAHQASTGDQHAAIATYRRSSTLSEQVLAADPDNVEARHMLADNALQEAQLTMLLGNAAEAIDLAALAVKRYEALAAETGNGRFQPLLATALVTYARHLDWAGRQAEASANASRSIGILEELAARFPERTDVRQTLAKVYSNVETLEFGPVRDDAALERALALNAKALAIDKQLLADTQSGNVAELRSVAVDHINRARLLHATGQYESAVLQARLAIGFFRKLVVDEKNAQLDVDLGQSAALHARALRELGRLAEAEQTAREGIVMLERAAARSDNLVVQYNIAANQEVLGGIHERRAGAAGAPPAERQRERQLAQAAYQDAMPRFRKVMDAVTLDFIDLAPIENVRAGLARGSAVSGDAAGK